MNGNVTVVGGDSLVRRKEIRGRPKKNLAKSETYFVVVVVGGPPKAKIGGQKFRRARVSLDFG